MSMSESFKHRLTHDGIPSPEEMQELLRLIDTLETERQRERDVVLQAEIEQNTFRALIAAHDALVTTHTQVATARERAETALQETEARFRAIFAGAAIGIVLADMRG